ncbi:hypothetical protein TNCV_4044241 [Trichonephila clavipes]|nr:hypothetical protein TNCV_4044241 [Trichonephila clavipes]
MEGDQDCIEVVVKSLHCSAVKHTVRNEQYVVGHCHGLIGSHFEEWAFPFNVLYHRSQDIRVVRVVYGSTGRIHRSRNRQKWSPTWSSYQQNGRQLDRRPKVPIKSA